MSGLTIGQVASRVGVAVDTVRYYERIGMLPRAPRRASGYRVFDETTVERIRLIKRLQGLGLSLQEIAAMLRAAGRRDASCTRESEKIRTALARVDEQLAALAAVRDKLQGALRRCTRGECTFLDEAARIGAAPSSSDRRREPCVDPP